jgi:mono/diheme cytochrome c family protein
MSARTLAILAAGLFGLASATLAADTTKKEGWAFGKDQYNARCAACHGVDGKGHGPAVKSTGMLPPPDLTTYAKRNGGKFPTELAWQKVDGRPTGWSEERSMPVWGREFRHEAGANPTFTTKPETYAAAEIYAVLEYVRGMQIK